MAQKPSIPKGTRDFTPQEISKRNYIFDIVKTHFQTFGYLPIETPSFENSDTLLGKYGEEGDRLIFKILNSGEYLEKYYKTIQEVIEATLLQSQKQLNAFILNDEEGDIGSKNILDEVIRKNFSKVEESISSTFSLEFYSILFGKIGLTNESVLKFCGRTEDELDKISKEVFSSFLLNTNSKKFAGQISEKALRYDLTVPFARYVVMHQNEIDFPFKRYQIQPVWRADRPQKGRFREFYQCDADVVGSDSLLQEVELVQLYDAVFTNLGLKGATIKLNNRKILSGIAEVIGAKHLLVDFTVALDKLDKIGEEGVKKEMREKGISDTAIEKAAPLFTLKGTNTEQLASLDALLQNSEEGTKGVAELRYIIESIAELGLQTAQLSIDVTLARGLNYYTGAIFEVSAPEGVKMGSIGGGGRYDDLTGIFGLKNVSGVGISFGLDRIYLVLEELNLFPKSLEKSVDVLCLNFGEKESLAALKLVTELRKAGIKSDVYPSNAKIQKQFKYANNRKVPTVILLGAEELSNRSFVAKNMETGEQKTYKLGEVNKFVAEL